MSTQPPGQIQSSSTWPAGFVALLAIALPTMVAVLKINALNGWRYTSDLFHVDLCLQETLRGNFTLDFAYGREFGDHACPALLLFLPIKALLGQWMIYFLAVIPAIVMPVCGVILFRCARSITGDPTQAAVAAVVYFLSVGAIRGPFEATLGFHVDTLSGYVAVAMAALLTVGKRRAAIGALVMFCLLKEEMALLGLVFFAALLVLQRGRPRERSHWIGLAISGGLFVVEMAIIRLCRTPWNRGNDTLVWLTLDQVREKGLIGFFFSADKIGYWLVVVSLVAALALCVAAAGRANRYALALAAMGLCKIAFSWAARDFNLWTWHNYPGLVMLSGAIALQTIEIEWKRAATVGGLVAASVAWFAFSEVPFFVAQTRANRAALAEANRLRPALLDAMEKVDKAKVTAIPKYVAREWTDGYRYTFFPNGISGRVPGIADQLILPRNKAALESPAEMAAFTPVYRNGHYRVFVRTGFLSGEEESRRAFVEMFGRDALGLPPEKPKSARRKPARSP